MITRRSGFPPTTDPNGWLGRSGKASYYPSAALFKVYGNQAPAGALQAGAMQVGPTPALVPVKPRLMMDPSDPTTWQRPYRFS
jgi:hypothetical protein